jgi:chromosome segregation ATPase
VVQRVQELAARVGNPTELVQLAQRMRITALMSADPFAKVKGMIQEMIEKLVEEAGKEAEHKAYCDKEMGETKIKMEDKTDDVDDLNTSIDQATSKIAKLSEDIATLQNELAQIAAAQKEATELREKEKEAWAMAKKDYEGGLEGVGMALQVLRDYYAEKEDSLLQESKHEKSSGAASGIIGMLEVVESDFSKLLAEGSADEDQAQKAYDDMTQENKVTTATKETEVKYKTKDKKETEERLIGLKEDKESVSTEYAAIMEYWEKLQPMCIAKPEPYAERKRRREAEIKGLKEALTILEEEAGSPAFLQIRTARRA